MKQPKFVTIMLIPDGADARWGFRIRKWLLQAIVILMVVIIVGIIVFFSVYGKILARAARAEKLSEENQRLLRYQYKVMLLEENLKDAREIVGRLTELAGIDYQFPELPDDSALFASFEEKRGATMVRPAGLDLSFPSGLPAQGFISQDFEVENQERYHPGVDIACAEGTPVLATANGVVEQAISDSIYGLMIVLRHSDSTTTLYGHNRELLAKEQQEVMAGSRIALSGNTGQSTAPHLHYEVRIHDKPIDPLGEKND
ncbi:MAG: M23 family metallopeptidase [bacterium]